MVISVASVPEGQDRRQLSNYDLSGSRAEALKEYTIIPGAI